MRENINTENIGEQTFRFFTEGIKDFNLKPRDGQLDMACEIVDGMKKNLPGIMEAGVGIGKSYAYLVPLFYATEALNKTMVVSTSTIVLQNQLFEDAKKVSKMLNINIPIFNLKGQTNYICRKRLLRYKNEFPAYMTQDLYKNLIKCGTQDKTREIPFCDESTWDLICIKKYGKNCANDACKYCNNCLYNLIRSEVRKSGAKIVICNHDVLIADLKAKKFKDKRIIDNDVYSIVVDECHHIEDKVRSAFTTEFYQNTFSRYLTAISAENTQYSNKVDIIQSYSEEINKEIREQIKYNIDEINNNRLFFDMPLPNEHVIDALNSLYIEYTMKNQKPKESVEKLYDLCSRFLKKGKDSNYIFWLDTTEKIAKICYAPKDIASISNKLFFRDKSKRIFFTSGTITDCDDFSGYKYFAESIGYPLNGILYEQKKSPFNNDKVSVFVPQNLDASDELAHREKSTLYINDLLKRNNGNTLILFTSMADMHYVYDKIVTEYPVFIQTGRDNDTLTRFKETKNSILLSTNVWEGFDVKGEKLSQVIIYKLPFPVPDPIIDSKCDGVLDKMYSVIFPEMLIKLKQGCGRLIRDENDSGTIAILDSRAIEGRYYSEEILKALPYKNVFSKITY